jgi:hypothetical protein
VAHGTRVAHRLLMPATPHSRARLLRSSNAPALVCQQQVSVAKATRLCSIMAMGKTTIAPRNPFVYGRVLSVNDAACARMQYEKAILETARNQGRLALVGDRRLGKSSLVERTLEAHKLPVLRWDFQKVLSLEDLIRRAAEDLDRFIGSISPIARRVTPWLREVGVAIQEIRLSYHGIGATLSTNVPTDHLKRLLSVILPLHR